MLTQQKISTSFLKNQINVNKNSGEADVKTEKDKIDESKITKNTDVILKYIKNNGGNAKRISLKSYGSNVNLHPLIKKILNAGKP